MSLMVALERQSTLRRSVLNQKLLQNVGCHEKRSMRFMLVPCYGAREYPGGILEGLDNVLRDELHGTSRTVGCVRASTPRRQVSWKGLAETGSLPEGSSYSSLRNRYVPFNRVRWRRSTYSSTFKASSERPWHSLNSQDDRGERQSQQDPSVVGSGPAAAPAASRRVAPPSPTGSGHVKRAARRLATNGAGGRPHRSARRGP